MRGGWEHSAEVLASIYYIPIVVAAISLGVRKAVVVALAAGSLHVLASVAGRGGPWLPPLAQAVLFVCVAVTAAKLAQAAHDGQALARLSKDAAAGALEHNFHEVQDNSEMSALALVLGGLVRQFRTPVASIEGAGWVLEDSRLPDEKREEFVGIIRKESRRLNRVLSDVQDFTRLHKPRYKTVALSPLVDEVIQLAGPKDHGPFFLFRADIPPDFPPLHCDPEQIRQALLNVALNAIQASPGGGQIDIVARHEQGNAIIRVKDHGHGIAPALLERIFDPFFTTNENSLGLGLTVALHIVSEHGGKIAVEATSEHGTCIGISLPHTS